MVAIAKTLTDKIDATAKEHKRISDGVKAYPEEDVTSADKKTIQKLKADAQILLDGSNLTKEERKALTTVSERIDSLTKTIEAAGIASVPDSYKKVKDINKDSVSLSNQDALEKAKADLEKAVKDFSKNYTAEETVSLNARISQVDGALKALEHVNSAIKAIEQLPNPEAVKHENRDSIVAANKLYDSLTAHEKSLISKEASEKLKRVCTALANLQLNDNTTGIKIEAVGDTTLDPNTELIVAPLKADEAQVKNVYAAASGSEIVGLFDISLHLDHAKIQPNGMVRISLTLTEEQLQRFKDFKIVYIDDNNVVTILPSTVDGGKIQFETNHFSCYGIIGSIVAEDSPTPGTTRGKNSSTTPGNKTSAVSSDNQIVASADAPRDKQPAASKDEARSTLDKGKTISDFSLLLIIIIFAVSGGAALFIAYKTYSRRKHSR
ncbi:MAG: hypothetical protein RR472_00005, partial [Anaerovoracaceae bacterium]